MEVTGKIVAKEFYEYIGKDGETHSQPTGRVVIDTGENAFVQWSKNVRIGMCAIIFTYISVIAIILVSCVNYAENITYEELCSATISLFCLTFLFETCLICLTTIYNKKRKGIIFGALTGGVMINVYYVYCRLHTVDIYNLQCITHYVWIFAAVYMILWISAQICVYREWRFRKNEFTAKVGAEAQEKPSGRFICAVDQAMGVAEDISKKDE